MVLNTISRQNRSFSSHFKLLFFNRLFSSSSSSSSSSFSDKLKKEYCFVSPRSLAPQNPNPNFDSKFQTNTNSNKKKQKPPYKPPSSLDRTGLKPLHSDLPFDFRYSYTESSQAVRPIGLREPKYSPFGPDRLNRVWTGVSAPAVDPTVKSVEGNGEDPKVEEKRRKMREAILGAPLTNAERKILVDKCQRNRTPRQVNLGKRIF